MIRFAALAVLLVPVPAAAEPPAAGVYGNVELSAESGDLGGVELELIGTGADARVEFVLCEGWCNEVLKSPAKFTDEGFTFEYVERWYDDDGSLTAAQRYTGSAVRNGDGLTLTLIPADAPENAFSYDLERIDERFGLAVAAGD